MTELHSEQPDSDSSKVVESWFSSLIPVGVAFVFYVLFILQSDIGNKGLFFAYGFAAGFIGLEAYWIQRGFRSRRPFVVLLGIVGITVTLGVLKLYLAFN